MMATALDWAALLPAEPREDWQIRIGEIADDADERRKHAAYNTGSILESEAYALCAIASRIKARVVFEVGTFIGTSTLALALAECVQHVYTCDVSNDCLPRSEKVHTYPHCTSTGMWRDLRGRGVLGDLCFFDGTLSQVDVDALRGLTHKGTVFAFHDYNYGPKIRKHGMETVPRKGIGNVTLLKPWLTQHVLIEPLPETTLALLVPEGL